MASTGPKSNNSSRSGKSSKNGKGGKNRKTGKSGKRNNNNNKNNNSSNNNNNNNNDKTDEKESGHKRAVMETLTRKDRREFREAFQLFDKDDDGTITIAELQEVFTGLNFHFTDSQLTQMINTIDDNGDGKIDLEEFILMMRGDIYNDPSNSKTYREELRDAFDVFDKDGNGSITVQELQSTMAALGENLTQDDIFAMIGEVDADGDGNIDFPGMYSICYYL